MPSPAAKGSRSYPVRPGSYRPPSRSKPTRRAASPCPARDCSIPPRHQELAPCLKHIAECHQEPLCMPIYRDESDQQQDDSVNRIAWFFTGALIGATVAILYAPKSGKDVRQYIADKAEGVDSARENIVEASRDMFDRGRKLVEDASELFERGRKIVRG